MDMISSEYGWTDEQILALPLGRLWQVRDAILHRWGWEYERQVMITQAQTQYLVAAMHGAAGSKLGERAARGVKFLREKAQRVRQLANVDDMLASMRVTEADIAKAEEVGRGADG